MAAHITDRARGWITEAVDLSEFAGHQVELRFDYVTDGAVTGEGLALDNVAIPAINYLADFNSNDGGWIPEGFAWIENILPQPFLISIINTSDTSNPVQSYQVNAGETLTIDLNSNSSQNGVVIAVSGSSRYSRQLADYSISVTQK